MHRRFRRFTAQSMSPVLKRPLCNGVKTFKTSSLTLIDIYNEFKEWYKDCYPQSKIPNSLDLQDYLSKKWGPSDKKKYLNKKFLY